MTWIRNIKEGERGVEFTPMAYLVRASLRNRLSLTKSQGIADHLLNQVGVLAGEHLEDLVDFFRVVEKLKINSFKILSEYRVNPEITSVSEEEIELMLRFGMDHLRTVTLRAMMPEVTLPIGDGTDTITVEEAWRVALKSPLEAYTGICRKFPGEMAPDIEEVARTISWCRWKVGLILGELL